MKHLIRRRGAPVWFVIGLACSVALVIALPAAAVDPDTTPPVINVATLSPSTVTGNTPWYRSPVTLNLSATDDVSVSNLQYSLDGGATYIDAPITPGPSVSASPTISQEGNTTVRYRAIDSSGNFSPSTTTTTTLNQPAAAGATGVRLASTSGRTVGERLWIGTAATGQEQVTIASIPSPAPASPNPNVILTAPLVNSHVSTSPGNGVFPTFRTIAVEIDTQPPVATWPGIVNDEILQSKTLTPTLTDPRRQFVGDTANGSGGSAYWTMNVDGTETFPHTIPLNTYAVGPHSETVAVQDVAGNRENYTRNFVVTTSFADLDTVLTQYTSNALSTTLASATVAGATGLRLTTPFGFRVGQTVLVGPPGPTQETATISAVPSPPPTVSTTLANAAPAGTTAIRLSATIVTNGTPIVVAGAPLVIDSGANQELVTVGSVVTPAPAAPAPNVILSAPLAKDHPAGTATTLVNVVLNSPLTLAHATGAATPVSNPRPLISAAAAANLHALLTQASTAAGLGQTAGAINYLKQFISAVQDQVKPVSDEAAEREALTSAAHALIDQVQDKPVDTSTAGTTSSPGTPLVRVFWDSHPFVNNPAASYRVLVNGRSGTNGSYRHESIVDIEALVQQLGDQNGFNVDIWDPNIGGSPGRQAPAGVSLTTSPFLDLATLMQYKTIVFDSTVGRDPGSSLNATEFANFQAYVRAGGGVVAIHGATDAYQAVPWYEDLVGAGFTNHGSNSTGGIMPDCGACGEVQVTNVDPGNVAVAGIAPSFWTHDELYNYNRDPVSLGIVHPLLDENENTLVNQLNYSPGPLMNTDKHAMVWCRNFDGGRSFTIEFGHSWQLTTTPWFVQTVLKGIQTTAGVVQGNCVTFNEVSDLLATSLAAGGINSAGNTALSAPLASADSAYIGGDYQRATSFINTFVKQTERPANCKNAMGVCPDGGVALGLLNAKGLELIDWMNGL